ncbi:MAG: hypothetical protein U5N56_07935 [Candidatus Marinimicrobia bacterium]|nr:hypothetical protein [Candidatus Neomarinimicrobiota bacterium]
MVDSIANVLKRRDGLSEKQAEERVQELRNEFYQRLEEGDDVWDLMDDVGLEPDYLEEFL